MTPANLSFLYRHLGRALDGVPTQALRLFHGRGRCWQGLEQITVDWLQGIVLVCLFREPPADELAALQAMLLQLSQSGQWQRSQAHGLLLQHRYQPDSPMQCLVGELPDAWTIEEDGLRFVLDLGGKQNTGLFLDMRLGRRWVRENANGQRVLNLFAYTCAFSIAALAGGAAQVVNLDMAKAALSRGRDNHRLNGHDLGRVSFLGHELFKSWAKVKRHGPYDLIIIDPPSFQKGSFTLTRDYQKILRKLPELLSAKGRVLACVNDPSIGSDFLITGMATEAPELHFERRLENPAEFPDAQPEGGLKAMLFSRA